MTDKTDYYLHERHFGAFERYFQLPEGADREKIEASFKKGVLTVTLPKTQEARGRKEDFGQSCVRIPIY